MEQTFYLNLSSHLSSYCEPCFLDEYLETLTDKDGHRPVFQSLGLHQGEQDKIPGRWSSGCFLLDRINGKCNSVVPWVGVQGILPGKDLELDVRG